jgi:hypothetical protein
MVRQGQNALPTITVELPADLVEHLRQKAAGAGEPLDTYLERLTHWDAPTATAASPSEVWAACWRAWARSRPTHGGPVDDSREAAYEGCGE